MSSPHPSATPAQAPRALSGPIVVGFDGEPHGRDALVLGRQLSELTGEPLVVAVVRPLELYVAPDPVLVSDLDAAQFEEADELVEQAAEVLGGEEGRDWRRSVIAARSPALGLHRIIDRLEAGMVVVGRTHRHGAAQAYPGTTAGRLLHGSPCPVAIAPPGWASREDGLRKISAGVGGSEEALLALGVASELAARAGTPVEAVAVYHKPNPANPAYAFTTKGYTEAMKDLRAVTEQHLRDALSSVPGTTAEPVVLEGKPAEALARHGDARDLLVIGSRAYGPLRSVAVGDVATHLAAEAPCALLVVPRGAASAP
jgi:nucleotide-binding universal stress UspA family protein